MASELTPDDVGKMKVADLRWAITAALLCILSVDPVHIIEPS